MTTQPDSMTKDEGLLPCPFCGVGAPAVWLYRDKPNHGARAIAAAIRQMIGGGA